MEQPLFQEDAGWVGWPERCEEEAVLEFLRRHDQFLRHADHHGFRPTKRRCISIPNKPITDSISKRKLYIGLVDNSSNKIEENDEQSYDWPCILVPAS